MLGCLQKISCFRALAQISSSVCVGVWCVCHQSHMEHQKCYDPRIHCWANWFWLIVEDYLLHCSCSEINPLFAIRGWTSFTLLTCTSTVMNDLTVESAMAWYCYKISKCRDLCLKHWEIDVGVCLRSEGRGGQITSPGIWDKQISCSGC